MDYNKNWYGKVLKRKQVCFAVSYCVFFITCEEKLIRYSFLCVWVLIEVRSRPPFGFWRPLQENTYPLLWKVL